MEIFDISTIMQYLGEKNFAEILLPFQGEFRKTISSFF